MLRSLILAVCAMLLLTSAATGAVPASIGIQGRLTDSLGNPLPAGIKGFLFRIFDAPTAGTEIWSGEDQFLPTDADGLWSARVGAIVGLNAAVFADSVRWLEIVANGTTLPRVRLATGPYAFRVETVDGASGGNIISKVSIGPSHINTGTNAFVAGEDNEVSGGWSTVAGGNANIASGLGAAVGGGFGNQATGDGAVVAGGGYGTVDLNVASGFNSVISGGLENTVSAGVGVIGGGRDHHVAGIAATIAGGFRDTANGQYSAIGGGNHNLATGDYATIGGGNSNVAKFASTVGGGQNNNASATNGATIGGGTQNTADGSFSTIGGGYYNRTYGNYSVIGGGGGGQAIDSNFANGIGATIPGGSRNRTNGNFAFAAGRRAQANHDGTFVWADSSEADFTSTADDQFLIRAGGGVGIGTNAPGAPLHVQEGSAGSISVNGNACAVLERNGETWLHILSPDANQRGILFGSPANSLMGSIRFNPPGTEKGYHFRCGNNAVRLILDSLGNLTADGCVVGSNIACPSDARFKKDIRTLPDALETVERLRGVSYSWNREQYPEREFPSGRQVGLIAQEVREVVPQAVIEQQDGYLAVDYARLVPLLIEGLKDQQRQIDKLKKTIDSMTL